MLVLMRCRLGFAGKRARSWIPVRSDSCAIRRSDRWSNTRPTDLGIIAPVRLNFVATLASYTGLFSIGRVALCQFCHSHWPSHLPFRDKGRRNRREVLHSRALLRIEPVCAPHCHGECNIPCLSPSSVTLRIRPSPARKNCCFRKLFRPSGSLGKG